MRRFMWNEICIVKASSIVMGTIFLIIRNSSSNEINAESWLCTLKNRASPKVSNF